MGRTGSIRRWCAPALVAGLLCCAPAAASPNQESILQDDPLVLGAKTQSELDGIFATLRFIGVDRLRVSLFWDHVAPANKSQRSPRFPSPGPSWPGSYPRGAWKRYDRIVLAAQRSGVGLLFSATGPGPAWSTPGRRCRGSASDRSCQEGIHRPSPEQFRAFVKAAGIRYSGAYPIDRDPPPPRRGGKGVIEIGGVKIGGGEEPEAPPQADPGAFPRVDHWSLWNEPNYPAWLLPIWKKNGAKSAKGMVPIATNHYRKLVDAGYAGLSESGHGGDTILIGETSPRGSKNPRQLGAPMMPAEFARELFCVKPNYRPYTGRAARQRGCPATRSARRRFVRRHPGLFRSQGWAHHPYSLAGKRWHPPTWRHRLKDNVSIGNLRRLTATLDRAASAWRNRRRKSIWITEYGYQTNPPDPVAGVAPSRQGPLTAWGEYLAYRNPRVASIAQFLLMDDRPLPGFRGRDPRRWISWQSGLFSAGGQPKPFLHDYTAPLHVTRHGRRAWLFATLRPAVTGTPVTGVIQFARRGGRWRNLRTVRATNIRGYVNARVRPPGAGRLRITWKHPLSGALIRTRAARLPSARPGRSGSRG